MPSSAHQTGKTHWRTTIHLRGVRTSHDVLFCQPARHRSQCFHFCSLLYCRPENYHVDGDNDTWYLYLIRTADNALYTGITTDVQRRYKQHQSGKGAKALRGKGELTLAFAAQVGDRSLALRIEYRVKQLTKRQKERLVEGEGLEALLSSLQAPDVKND